MTAPAAAISLSPELVARFGEYHRRQLAWGIFHVALDDCNWECAPAPETDRPWTEEERELAALFVQMTPTQRRKLSHRARLYLNTGSTR